ncbi:MAG: nicotinate (nicotinamide) nucleotide adenylyltransferase [Bacilli bacterium]|nr:nicotinate (nicotinamide) nucleotide adenylyltransferase [Bacilli bacterium]
MKLGVFIGSFNPVHKGHIKIANHLLKKDYIDKLLIIPTQNYWNKNNLINIQDRINMLKIFENKKIIINTKDNNIKYTYNLLKKLQKEYQKDELYLIIGADNILRFKEWKNYKKILKYNLIIVNRNKININIYLDKLGKKDKYIIVNDLKNIDISSSLIRKLIKENNLEKLQKIIDKKVLGYIKNKNLYKGE